jgi:CheY-like chemotaxis protein
MALILLIDDDDAVRNAIGTMLRYGGHTIVPARGGAEGIAAAAANDVEIAFVDLMMPGMDGMETIRRLHALKPAIPIIAMSGFMARDEGGGDDYLARARATGASEVLQKPFRPKELRELLAACLARSPAQGRPG